MNPSDTPAPKHRGVLSARRIALLATTIAVLACGSASSGQQAVADPRPANAPDQKPAFAGQTDARNL